jgi:hypothetical protein
MTAEPVAFGSCARTQWRSDHLADPMHILPPRSTSWAWHADARNSERLGIAREFTGARGTLDAASLAMRALA